MIYVHKDHDLRLYPYNNALWAHTTTDGADTKYWFNRLVQ
jgi:hypothetical protein